MQFKLFDTIAFCGLSGAVLAPTLAHLMQKELLLIRKKKGDDGSHSMQWVEGYYDASRVIVVDDLVFSGDTMRNIRDGIKDKLPGAKVVGLLLHSDYAEGPRYVEQGHPLFDRYFA